ncbi:beta-ketoacyl-[acyl-carrier-protein] synthase II [Candidatus Aerophobetes bacterium]|uniref:3-oxoacyl-[acyl-carrier-protein] synthase 2 n=1 Tax=Aerophobetes bacterium TaxID=2030807 RepID=A0A2A4X0I2_UNCAE|nr:MAG: beta-ketoacyl-[acyl-carrier-protein] synthase II [Candidatus Aerophobetes bacterium]
MAEKRRIVITGLGIVSCFGSNVDTFFDQLVAGKSGVTMIDQFPCEDYSTRFAGSVRDVPIEGYMDKKQARRVDPFIRYSMVAGKKALEDGGLTPEVLERLDKKRCGILISSGMGGMSVFYEGTKTLLNKGHNRITPFFVPYIITNMAGALLSIDLGFKGPCYSISTACATANYSMCSAASHIRNGEADLIICGGAEAPINPVGVGGFVVMKALSKRNDEYEKASRPWDKGRDGFVMGEGAGVLILEELEHAKKRGAKIYAEFLGGGLSTDAYHMTAPQQEGEGVAQAMHYALDQASIGPEDINYINAHATSTMVGDLCELRAINKVFGKTGHDHVVINSTKSLTGHCLGAAAGIEAIALVKSIERGVVHPNINLDDPEEEAKAFRLPKEPVEMKITAAMNNSFGFGGHNSVTIFAPYKGD